MAKQIQSTNEQNLRPSLRKWLGLINFWTRNWSPNAANLLLVDTSIYCVPKAMLFCGVLYVTCLYAFKFVDGDYLLNCLTTFCTIN